jgi:NAD(P)-dependent dehydrogenase (short-subunit alcohol dehydrogenase family)
MKPLHGKNILVTGATQGIGRSVAIACAVAGANVLLLGRNQKRLMAVDDEIRELTGRSAHLIQFDLALTGAEEYRQLTAAIEENFSHLSALVHCAAIFHGLAPLEVFAADKFFSTLQANFHARYLLTLSLLPLLRRGGAGDVVFTLSPLAEKGQAYWGAYALAEAATRALYEVWSEEMAHDVVRLHMAKLPHSDTRLFRKAYPFYEQPLEQPENAANIILNLLISESESLTT